MRATIRLQPMEAADVVLARLRASPDTVFVARAADGVCAYLFAYPSRRGKVTPLGGAFALPPVPDTLCLHDLAVAPRADGRGLARRLVARLLDHAAALATYPAAAAYMRRHL